MEISLNEHKLQATEAVTEAKQREDFMAQYGWQDSKPMGPPDENWSLPSWAVKDTEQAPSGDIPPGAPAGAMALSPEETPAAAAEFSDQEQNISRQNASNRKVQPDSPSVFDIGLSDATIKMFVNKAKPQASHHLPSPLSVSSKTLAASASSSRVTSTATNMAATYLSTLASSKSESREHPVSPPRGQAEEAIHDSTVGASPELQLRSALPSLQVSLMFTCCQSMTTNPLLFNLA